MDTKKKLNERMALANKIRDMGCELINLSLLDAGKTGIYKVTGDYLNPHLEYVGYIVFDENKEKWVTYRRHVTTVAYDEPFEFDE